MVKLLSVVSKGNRIASVRTRTDGNAGFEILLTEFKISGGEVSKKHYTRLYKMLSTSIRDAEEWVSLATE